MNKYFKPGIGLLRLIGFLEGVSFLILVFIAMPFKYLGNNPLPVQIVGQAHGILFILFIIYSLIIGYQLKWKLQIQIQVIISSVIPFGTFYIDKKIFSKI
jgi:integral membrane protein